MAKKTVLRGSTINFKGYPLEDACRRMVGVGYTGVEFWKPQLSECKTPELIKQFASYSRRIGLEPVALNDVDNEGFKPFDPHNGFEHTLELLKENIDMAHALSVNDLMAWEGVRPRGNNQPDKELLKTMIQLYREATRYGKKRNVRIVVEPHPFSLGMSMEYITGLCDALDGRYFGVLYDCCHYGVGKPNGYVKAIGKLGDRIKYIHFSDSDQRTSELHYPLGMGRLDIDGIVGAFAEIGYEGMISLDIWGYPLPEEASRIGLPVLRKTMDKLGLH